MSDALVWSRVLSEQQAQQVAAGRRDHQGLGRLLAVSSRHDVAAADAVFAFAASAHSHLRPQLRGAVAHVARQAALAALNPQPFSAPLLRPWLELAEVRSMVLGWVFPAEGDAR